MYLELTFISKRAGYNEVTKLLKKSEQNSKKLGNVFQNTAIIYPSGVVPNLSFFLPSFLQLLPLPLPLPFFVFFLPSILLWLGVSSFYPLHSFIHSMLLVYHKYLWCEMCTTTCISFHVTGVCLPNQSAAEKHNQEKSPHSFAHLVNFSKHVSTMFCYFGYRINKAFACSRCVICVSCSVHFIETYYVRKGS